MGVSDTLARAIVVENRKLYNFISLFNDILENNNYHCEDSILMQI